MRKIVACFCVLCLLLVCSVSSYAKKETKEVEVTTEVKYTQQLRALAQKRRQYLEAIQKIEVEMIKLQAVIEYINTLKKESGEN